MNQTFAPIDVSMHVRAGRSSGPCRPVWNWFGHDEPNYASGPSGKALLAKLAELSQGPAYVRTHNLLTSGDGTPALKWGSTDAYREAPDGTVSYHWDIMDGLFDAWVDAGITPFIQAGFTPKRLSDDPGPYRHAFSTTSPYATITTGWAAPPNDIGKWSALIEAWAAHLVGRYGAERVRGWPWEFWNEPDGHYWTGTIEQFCAFHEATVRAIRRAIPEARVGGPHTCGPWRGARASAFLREFLAFCAQDGSGREDLLDFVAFHAKGKPEVEDGRVRMGLAHHLNNIDAGLRIVAEHPSLDNLPVIVGESDPEGCAACPASVHPENAYRNGPLYGAYVAEATMRSLEIARLADREIEGLVTWAFLFDGQPTFAGFRDLSTNGIDKAVLNAFRLMGGLQGDWIEATSTARLPLADLMADGARGAPDIDVVAARDARGVTVLCWHNHDDDVDGPDAKITLEVDGLPRSDCGDAASHGPRPLQRLSTLAADGMSRVRFLNSAAATAGEGRACRNRSLRLHLARRADHGRIHAAAPGYLRNPLFVVAAQLRAAGSPARKRVRRLRLRRCDPDSSSWTAAGDRRKAAPEPSCRFP